MAESTSASGSLLFVCNVGWFFNSHRLALAKAARAQGYKVHVACDIETIQEAQTINEAGLEFHRIRLSRGGANPLRDIRTFVSVFSLLLRHRPTLVHNISIKPVLYGSIAARIAGVRGVVNAISGLGYVFTESERAGLLRRIARWLYRIALNSSNVRVIFQNEDDRREFVHSGLVRENQTVLIAGSGVDLDSFAVAPEPATSTVRILFPARMLIDKGVREFAAAALLMKKTGLRAECVMAGGLDRSNPAALSEAEVRALEAEGAVQWLGHVSDMPRLLRDCHIVCLPSYREGMPKALVEACAAGRPIVTTRVPGCRDVVREDENGLLVPPRDVPSLCAALERLVQNRQLRSRMGARGREIAEREFGIDKVVERTLLLYRDLAQRSARRGTEL
jgi:glycosyltransferase involved in cell wall biosynthesis